MPNIEILAMDILKLDLNKATPDPPRENEIRFQVSLLAAVPALIAGFVARFVFDAPLVPEVLAQFIFAVAPIWVVEVAVGMLGPFAKHLAFLGCTVVYLIALMAVAIVYLRYAPRMYSVRAQYGSVIGVGILLWALTVVILLPAVGGGIGGSRLRQGALATSIALLSIHLVYALALALAAMRYIGGPDSANTSRGIIGRRRVVRGIGYAVLAIGLFDIGKSLLGSWLQSGSGRVKNGDGVFPNIDNLALEITPTRDFYQVSKNAFDPQVDGRRWKLEVAGLVNNPLSLTYDEIKSLPSIEQYATLACIS